METERPAPTRKLPRTIGRYRIVGRLGKGAMGVVYSAHDSLMERSVAIKVMMTDLEEDPETSARFYREARSAGQLVHPNIITIFDMGEDEGRPFIVMELLEADTLNKYLERPEAADLGAKIDLMIQICEGLQAAHSHGIYHRDIKPGNLLVRPTGELKIVDFGIARLASSNMTASGLMVGTPDYMSPEQARGQEVDQRSDIFSAGSVFYLMLTGRKPFAAPDLTGVLAKVQGEDPLPIRETEAPPSLSRVVMKALAKPPEERYQTCAAIIGDLERLKRELETEAAQWFEQCGDGLKLLESLAHQARGLSSALELVPAPGTFEQERADLRDRYLSLSERPRRGAVADLLGEIRRVEQAAAGQVDRWQRALRALEEGARAASAGRTREAVASYELVLRIEPASRRATADAGRCRELIAERRAIDDRANALLDEARKAAAARQWEVVVGLCNDALLLESRLEEAAALKRKAVEAIDADVRARKVEGDRALARAEAFLRKARYQEAAQEIARARSFASNAAEVAAAEERLRSAIAHAERAAESERQVAEAIAVARQTFSSGQRDQAIAELRAFQARSPDASVAAEISRLDAEATRIADAERRAAEATELAHAAEAALASGKAHDAAELARRALAADPGHVVARRVSGLAAAQVKQREEAQARVEAASRHIEEAKQQLARGKYQKARALVSTAAELNPANSQYKHVLARIEQEEARAEAEAEYERQARQRAKAVAPILERARAAEAQRDYARAAWTAENALAVDLECVEAKEILQRAKAQLDAEPGLAEETVDLIGDTGRQGDPDDTVSLTRPAGVWERIVSAVKNWTKSEGAGAAGKRQGADSERIKT